MFEMVEDKIRLGFHSLVVACYTVGSVWALFLCDFTPATDERVLDMQRYGGRYFTTWNFIFHLIYFGIALNEDLIRLKNSCPTCLEKISKIKGYIFTTLIIPSSTYVSGVFWTIFTYDRELVFPLATDEVVPLWFNHLVHTITFVFMILEFYFTDKNTTPSLESVFLGFSVLNVAYYSIFFYTKSRSGRYFYGIFHQLPFWQIVLFILASFLLSLLVIKCGIFALNFIKQSKTPATEKFISNEYTNGNVEYDTLDDLYENGKTD